MHIAVADLGLDHLWVIYPGTERYPLGTPITALPLREVFHLDLAAMAHERQVTRSASIA